MKKIDICKGGPYVSDLAGLNRGPLFQNRYTLSHFVHTCKCRINTFLILASVEAVCIIIFRPRTRTLLTPNRHIKFHASKTNKKYCCACDMTF